MTSVVEPSQVEETKPEDRPVEDLAEAVDQAVARLDELDRGSRQIAEDMRAATDAAHRAALVHIVRRLREDPRGKELLFELADDPVVRMALLVHQIIRPDPMTQALSALDQVRPQLESHGGGVELDRVEDGVAYVRLQGACNGCSMASVTMRNGVEEALKAAVPGLSSVEVLPNEPGPALIPLSEIGVRPEEIDLTGWTKTRPLSEFALGTLVAVDEADAVVINLDGQLTCYRNACAHMGLPLDDAELDIDRGTVTCSWHGYCFDAREGECQSLPGAQLEPLPLRVHEGHVWIRAGD